MSTTTTERVPVDRDAIVEAIAQMQAAASILVTVFGGSETPLAESLDEAGWKLFAAAFGDPRTLGILDSRDWDTNPAVVSVEVRAGELASSWLIGVGDDGRRRAEEIQRVRETGSLDFRTEDRKDT